MVDPITLDSDDTRLALELLIAAVRKEAGPGGGIEARLAVSMLEDLMEEPTEEAFTLASKAFSAIDGRTRRRIATSARVSAESFLAAVPKAGQPVEVARRTAVAKQATGFLQALNSGSRPRPGPKGGR